MMWSVSHRTATHMMSHIHLPDLKPKVHTVCSSMHECKDGLRVSAPVRWCVAEQRMTQRRV